MPLDDALDVLELMEELDEARFERAAAVWLARFAAERKTVELSDVRAAAKALDALPGPDGRVALKQLLERHPGR